MTVSASPTELSGSNSADGSTGGTSDSVAPAESSGATGETGTPDASTSDASTADATPSGWDYGLTHAAITSPFPDDANYFSDLSGATGNGQHWTIAVESEQQEGVSAPGPMDQSFPIYNVTANPTATPGVVRMQAVAATDSDGGNDLWINLTTDFYNNPDPAGADFFTWFAFGENVDQAGGPLPRPDQVGFDVNALYTDYLPAAGARVSVDWQGWWNNQSYEVEIDLNRASNDWGADTGQLVQNTCNTATLDFVQLNGAALGLTLTPGVLTHLHVDWSDIIQTLVDQGVLPAPVGGWNNSATQAMYMSTEFMDNTAADAGIASLWFNGFEVSTTSAGAPDSSQPLAAEGALSMPGSSVVPATPEAIDVTYYADSIRVQDGGTGALLQSLPPSAGDALQFLAADGLQYGATLAAAEALGLDPAALRDYGGNDLGAAGGWQLAGLASVRNLSAPSYILVNPVNGRWAEVATQPDGSFNFASYGANGDTRIVGIYQDPLIALGMVTAGGPDDSQARFVSDIQANRLAVLGSLPDPNQSGFDDLLFKLTNHSADHSDDVYLRAILYPDGNIQYANYMNASQFTAWIAATGTPAAVYSHWLSQI